MKVNTTTKTTPASLNPLPNSYSKKWEELGLESSLPSSHPDFVKLMIDTKLAFTVVGFFNTSDAKDKDPPIKLEDGMPHLKCEGSWISWEQFQDEFEFSEYDQKFISKQNRGESWTYTYPSGFIKEDPNCFKKAFPVFELSDEQYAQVKEIASKFISNESGEKDCIVQFYTSPELPSTNRWKKNLHERLPVHLGMRVITKDKKLYSFGLFGNSYITTDMKNIRNTLKTYNACIRAPDYYEFGRFYKRRITSIPTTSEKAAKILERITEFNQKGIRYNMFAQNCFAVADDILNELGYESPVKSLAPREFFWLLLPNAEDFYLGNLVKKAQSLRRFIPSIITANPIKTLCTSAFLCLFGASKQEKPQTKLTQEPSFKKPGAKPITCLYPTWKSLLNPDIGRINHHAPFMQWQLDQKSTFETDDRNKPKLHFLPKKIS